MASDEPKAKKIKLADVEEKEKKADSPTKETLSELR